MGCDERDWERPFVIRLRLLNESRVASVFLPAPLPGPCRLLALLTRTHSPISSTSATSATFFQSPTHHVIRSRHHRTESTRLLAPAPHIYHASRSRCECYHNNAHIYAYTFKSTATVFLVDVSPTMGTTRTLELSPGPNNGPRTKQVTHLQWSLQFAMLKIQEMVRLKVSVLYSTRLNTS